MIINSHVHLNTDNNFFFYNCYTLGSFLGEMARSGIDISFPCINPKVDLYRCPNDCSINCRNSGDSSDCTGNNLKINNNLQFCPCSNPGRHRVVLLEHDGKAVLKCKTCGKVISESIIDPLRKYNIKLILETRPYRHILKPLLYVSLCNATLQNEIDYFETNFTDDFIGFKFHPWNDQVSVNGFYVKTNRAILIHCGTRLLEHPLNAINFAKLNPKVRIIIAHAAALSENALMQVSEVDNVFIDCCPSTFLYKNKESSLEDYAEIHSPEDIYYKILDFVPSNRILFGTDSPWGNGLDELKVVRNLKVSKKVKEQILFRNAIHVYGL